MDRVERQNVGTANRIFVSADGMNVSSLTLFTKREAFFMDDILKHEKELENGEVWDIESLFGDEFGAGG